MGHQLTITEQPGYLHFRVTGQNTPQTVMAYLAEVSSVCSSRGCTAILMEEDLIGPGLPLLDIYHIVDERGPHNRLQLLRIAFVDVHQEERPGNVRFAETVALNRGLNLRAFRTVEEAAAWLRETERPKVSP
jgi:hypothetical protein